MNNLTRILMASSVIMMTSLSVYSQDIFKSANIGIGTTTPQQKLEIAGNNTIRIDGLIGATYKVAPGASTSDFIYVNANGDLYAMPNGLSGTILSISATGILTWASASSVANAWNFTGGNTVSSTWGVNYLGSNNNEPIEFEVNNVYSGVLDPTNENVYFGGTANGYYPGNDLSGTVAGAYNNVGIGTGSLGRVANGSWWNVGIGYLALASYNNTTNGNGNGSGSTGVGAFVLNHSTGTPNEGFGFQANYTLTTGMNNTSIGFAANWSNSTGNDDVAVGDSAAWGNTAGGIVAIGTSALRSNTATGNVAVGENALQKNTSGGGATMGNTAVGFDALENNTTTSQNNAFGFKTLSGNTSGQNNVAIGDLALNISTSASENVAIGTDVMSSVGSGNENVVIGEEALSQASASTQNTGVGAFALYANTNTASNNVAEGTGALYHNGGNYNTAIGWEASSTNTISGSNNVALGANALNNLTSGSNNTALGYQANISSGALSNATAIGNGATAPVSNSIVLGNSSVDSLYLPGYGATGEIFYTAASSGRVSALAPGTTGQILTISGGVPTWSAAGGSGTVTSFSAGNLSPLFTTSVATATTTPALSFTLNNAGAETILGNNTAIGATPTYFSPTLASALFANQGTTTTVLHGNASGNPSWGAVNLTTDVTGTLPVANGGTGLSTVGSNGQVLTVVGGAPAWATISGTNGGVIYGTGSGISSSGAGVAGQILESTGAGAPIWVNVSTLDTIVGDNWGSEYAYTDSITSGAVENSIAGTGLGTNPLRLAKQGAKNNQVLTWDSTANTWKPATPAGTGWQLTGNLGTTAGTNFIGTTDPNDLVFKTNDNEDMRISNSNGYVGMGTPTPQAALDVTSTTSGILIPRLASNPASPATAMMYYNTTSGCFMFYSGSTWQAIACGCPNVPAAGTITGSTTFCPGETGVTYSVTALNNAATYQWTVPTGATIASGQGSNSITVTFGSTSGNITVTPSNNCGTGTASTLAVTSSGSSPITSQPQNFAVDCASPGNATFSVTATGATGWQWMVSTNSGSTWSNVPNTSPYSGPTTATLTISTPPSTMNGYEYECLITGTSCGSLLSNAALLTAGASSVPITITNTVASSTTLTGLQVKLSIDFANYTSDGLNASLNNVLFSTGAGGSGTPLYAWIESPTAPTATATEFTTAPTSPNATAAVVWVNLGALIVTNGTPATIYMTFTPYTVMTGTTGYTGMAPQLTSTYAQYDNGLLVFPNFYDNFAGTTLNSKWTLAGGCTVTLNNEITAMTCGGHWYGIYTNAFTSALNTVGETYWKSSTVAGSGPDILMINIEDEFGGNSSSTVFGSGGTLTTSSTANQNGGGSTIANDWYVFSGQMTNSPAATMSLNYTLAATYNQAGGNITNGGIGLGVSSATPTIQWFRDRVLPPSGTLPTTSLGTYGCY